MDFLEDIDAFRGRYRHQLISHGALKDGRPLDSSALSWSSTSVHFDVRSTTVGDGRHVTM